MSYVKIERIKIGLQINIYHLGRWSLLIPSYLVLVQQIVGTLQTGFIDLFIDLLCFNATFSNISTISWRLVLMVEEAGEAGVPGENHRPWASSW